MAMVLVVEDHASARKPLMKLLRMEGYAVRGAANTLEAMAIVRKTPPSLIILDVMLPPMDGLTFLMLLRDDPHHRSLPVILLTGRSDAETASRATALGVKEYLIKTQITPQQLLDAVRLHVSAPAASSPGAPVEG